MNNNGKLSFKDNPKKMHPVILTMLVMSCCSEGRAQDLFTFDSRLELTNNFIQDDPSNMWYEWSAEAGVGSQPGRLDYGTTSGPGQDLNNLIYSRAFSLKDRLEMSIFFDYGGDTGGRPFTPLLQIGWTDDREHGIRVEETYSFVSVSLSNGSNEEGVLSLSSRSKTGFEDFRTRAFSDDFNLTEGLYQLRGEWSRTGNQSIDYSVELYSDSGDGSGSPILISRFSGVHDNGTIADDDSVFAAIRANGGGTYLDNFQVIPEPATGMLMLVGGMGIWIWRRGTRKRGF